MEMSGQIECASTRDSATVACSKTNSPSNGNPIPQTIRENGQSRRKSWRQFLGVWADGGFRRLLFRQLRSIKFGFLSVVDREKTFLFGQPCGKVPSATVTIKNPAAYRKIVLGGDLGFAECLIAGDIEVDDLVTFIRLLLANSRDHEKPIGTQNILRRWWSKSQHWLKRNTRRNSRRNIQAHYDLSNAFFSLWLDPTLSYSSGVFPNLTRSTGVTGIEWRSAATMEEASLHKLEGICRKLDLSPTDHLLEIGCGWGGLAIYAAQHYGCRVTGVTLSPAQLEIAQHRVHAAGLQDRVSLQLLDYRDLTGQFDKLVSIEMVEAVGHEYLEQYFQTCCNLLKPEGRMVLQGITIAEHRYQDYLKKVDFIREYIFPGGCLISNAAVLTTIAKVTDFRPVHLAEIGQHYAETLRRWRAAFHEQWEKIEPLGFDQRFYRLWDYYLAYCEAGFAEGHVGTIQMVLDRAKRTAPFDLAPSVPSPSAANWATQNGATKPAVMFDSNKLDTGKLDTGKLDTGKLDTVKLDTVKLGPVLTSGNDRGNSW